MKRSRSFSFIDSVWLQVCHWGEKRYEFIRRGKRPVWFDISSSGNDLPATSRVCCSINTSITARAGWSYLPTPVNMFRELGCVSVCMRWKRCHSDIWAMEIWSLHIWQKQTRWRERVQQVLWCDAICACCSYTHLLFNVNISCSHTR